MSHFLSGLNSSSSSSIFITFSHVVIRDREATSRWRQRLPAGRGEKTGILSEPLTLANHPPLSSLPSSCPHIPPSRTSGTRSVRSVRLSEPGRSWIETSCRDICLNVEFVKRYTTLTAAVKKKWILMISGVMIHGALEPLRGQAFSLTWTYVHYLIIFTWFLWWTHDKKTDE